MSATTAASKRARRCSASAFGGALRKEAPLVLRRHPGITPGLPHMRLADIEGGLRHKRAPPYTKPHTKHIQHIFHQRAPFKQRKPRHIILHAKDSRGSYAARNRTPSNTTHLLPACALQTTEDTADRQVGRKHGGKKNASSYLHHFNAKEPRGSYAARNHTPSGGKITVS